MKHNDRCPQCGKFVETDPIGYYDSDSPDVSLDDGARVTIFCRRRCAEKFHPKRTKTEQPESTP